MRRLAAFAVGFGVLVVLFPGTGSAGSAARPPAGQILASASEAIYLIDPADGRSRRVSSVEGNQAAFIPGRPSFAYIVGGGCAPAGGGSCFTEYSVFVKSLADRNPKHRGRRLFGWRDFFVRSVDVSPAGRVVFAAKPGPGPSGNLLDIYSSDLAGRHIRQLTRDPSFENDVVVSPNGRLIAFSRRVDGHGQIFVMRIDGSHETRLTHDGRRDRLPSWAPNSRRLVFISQPAKGAEPFGDRDLRTVTLGGVERRLTTVPGGDVDQPVYSPDGRAIAFLRGPGLWLMNRDGTHKRRLRRGPGYVGYEGGLDWGR